MSFNTVSTHPFLFPRSKVRNNDKEQQNRWEKTWKEGRSRKAKMRSKWEEGVERWKDEDRRGELCGSLDDSHDNSIFCDGCINGATSQSNYSEPLRGQNPSDLCDLTFMSSLSVTKVTGFAVSRSHVRHSPRLTSHLWWTSDATRQHTVP